MAARLEGALGLPEGHLTAPQPPYKVRPGRGLAPCTVHLAGLGAPHPSSSCSVAVPDLTPSALYRRAIAQLHLIHDGSKGIHARIVHHFLHIPFLAQVFLHVDHGTSCSRIVAELP